MNHPNEEQFILYYYGEDPGVPVAEHMAGCDTCRAEYRTLQRVLNTVETMPVPERGAEYGATVWNRIQPRLGVSRRSGWRGWFEWRRLALAAAMTCLIAGAFIAGRFARPAGAPSTQTATSGPVRERILLVAVGDHLDRSQMVLAEFSNDVASGADQQRAAADLVESNRLYRLTAVRNGDAATATVLEDLERVLLEIANAPSEVSQQQLSNVLFKVRVYATQVHDRETKL